MTRGGGYVTAMVKVWRCVRRHSGVVCAAFVALGGTAYAADGLQPNGAGTQHLKPTGHAALYCAPVYWRSARDGDQRCPRTHGLISDVGLIHLRWTKWSEREATGYGLSAHHIVLSCQPRPPYHCRTKIDSSSPIWIRLTRVKLCADGRRIYSRINLGSYSANRRHSQSRDVWSYYCRPRYTSRGSGAGGG